MTKIFISYRRDDPAPQFGRLFDKLVKRFGESNVFKDDVSIPPGADFRTTIRDHIAGSNVLLAMIGNRWNPIEKDCKRKLDNVSDYVRIELEEAFARGVPVIAVLLGTELRSETYELPGVLNILSTKQLVKIHEEDRYFNLDT